MASLPASRGPVSERLLAELREAPHQLEPAAVPAPGNPLGDEDLQLALYVHYELHYRGFDEVDDGWEWEPSLLAHRAVLERLFEDALFDAVGFPAEAPAPEEMDLALRAIDDEDDGPSLSK